MDMNETFIAPANPIRKKIGDDAMVMLIKTFSIFDDTQTIVDGIRGKGFQASITRVENLIRSRAPFREGSEEPQNKGKILQFKAKQAA
jgi:hypothetical protein